jgi:hypothetical protein
MSRHFVCKVKQDPRNATRKAQNPSYRVLYEVGNDLVDTIVRPVVRCGERPVDAIRNMLKLSKDAELVVQVVR